LALSNIIFRENAFLTMTRLKEQWFQQQPKEFYAAGFKGLVKWWDKCLNLCGNYVEK
jgi:hypothetical protein